MTILPTLFEMLRTVQFPDTSHPKRSSSLLASWGRVEFEAMARFVQEFLGHRQIARRFPTAYVAQIGRQVRKKTLDILSFSIPGHKPFGRQTYAGYADVGINVSMPTPRLCRLWPGSSPILSVSRHVLHFANKLKSA